MKKLSTLLLASAFGLVTVASYAATATTAPITTAPTATAAKTASAKAAHQTKKHHKVYKSATAKKVVKKTS